ncbi:MAG TPA: D-aminoacylase [Steroidobacteraceae bacterium]|jgi:N-acyl-D-amino-acid deacylase|nr:D-aminoacylase [Steroidobacteraceae bacterium]
MRHGSLAFLVVFFLCGNSLCAADVLIQNALVYDGTGKTPFTADVRVHAGRIATVGPHLRPLVGETLRDARGLVLSPGFIDMHTHADHGLLEDLDAATVSRQGVTTIFIGQDGESHYPLHDYFAQLEKTPPAINVASMIGHATLREQIMGKDLYRASTPQELARMKVLLAQELRAGAFGLSTGLEYEEGHFATTDEVVELSKVAAAQGGFYISHVRDEANHTFEAFDEVLAIGREAHIPVEITHIKLGSAQLWHMAATRMPDYFATAKRDHVNLMADVYPYTYWHSTIRVLVPDRDYDNLDKVAQAVADNGGARAIRLVRYAPEPTLAGKTLEEIAAAWKLTAAESYVRIVHATNAEVGAHDPMELVIVTSMSEDDVRWFIAQPRIMFCSDGELHGAHPRGAGSFPRILGKYVREQKVLLLETAIHKMTGLPAHQLHLKDRGRIAAGYIADLVLFDPAIVIDQSTIDAPEAPPLGIPAVMVSGEWVIDNGLPTGNHPGRVLRSPAHLREEL